MCGNHIFQIQIEFFPEVDRDFPLVIVHTTLLITGFFNLKKMKEIILNKINAKSSNYKKYIAFVDDEDFEKVNQYEWYANKNKHTFYARTLINGKAIQMHNFIMNGKPIDHIDHDGLNNQKSNLRMATYSQNNMNKIPKVNGSSKFKGVTWYKEGNKWLAHIGINKKQINLGYFVSEIEAAQAYNNKARELFGEFAYLNKI